MPCMVRTNPPQVFAVALLLCCVLPVLDAQQPPPPQTQDQPEAGPESIAGAWKMAVETQQGVLTSTLTVKLDGKKVTGTVASEAGVQEIAGEYADRKLTFSMTYPGDSGPMALAFTGTLKDDGTLAGIMDHGSGTLAWKAERVKDEKN